MRKYLFAILAVSLIAAGCGSSSSTPSSSTTPPGVSLSGTVSNHGTATAGPNSFSIDMYDSYFEPTFVKVQPNTKYTVALKNEGKIAHTFTISSMNIDVELQGGESKSIDLTTPASGATEFVCTFHTAMGMRGALYQ